MSYGNQGSAEGPAPRGDQDPGRPNSHHLEHGSHCARVEKTPECSTSAVAAHSSLAGSSHTALPAVREPGSPARRGHAGQKHVAGRPHGASALPARRTGGRWRLRMRPPLRGARRAVTEPRKTGTAPAPGAQGGSVCRPLPRRRCLSNAVEGRLGWGSRSSKSPGVMRAPAWAARPDFTRIL